MQDLSLHLLDILENSVRAEAGLIETDLYIDLARDILAFKIKDDGVGMDHKTLVEAENPFYTSKKEREKKVGLGIPLLKQNALHCSGKFHLNSEIGSGTELYAEFKYSHIDRMPLGEIDETILNSIFGHSDINFVYNIRVSDTSGSENSFVFDTREIKEELGDLPITFPDVVIYLRSYVKEEIKTIMEEVL